MVSKVEPQAQDNFSPNEKLHVLMTFTMLIVAFAALTISTSASAVHSGTHHFAIPTATAAEFSAKGQ